MKKIKILYVITGLSPGGAELTLKKIVNYLDLKKYEIFICGLTNNDTLVKDLKKISPHVYTLNIDNPAKIFYGLITLRRIIKIFEPDIIHCFMIHANIFGRLAAIGSNSYVISSVRNKLIEKKYIPFLLIDRFTQFLVDRYIALSNTVRAFMIKYGINHKNILIIKNGIDFNALIPSKDPNELKRELEIGNEPIITCIAHFRPQKDYLTLIKALAILRQQHDFTFIAAGIIDQYPKVLLRVKSLIRRYGMDNIKILGFRKDIKSLLSITDIWVSSTRFEGLSNSLLEAMAFKKPIVTTDIPENSEVVKDGVEALLVPISNPEGMANAIAKILHDDALSKRLASNAYDKVKKSYDLEIVLKDYFQLYEEIFRSRN